MSLSIPHRRLATERSPAVRRCEWLKLLLVLPLLPIGPGVTSAQDLPPAEDPAEHLHDMEDACAEAE